MKCFLQIKAPILRKLAEVKMCQNWRLPPQLDCFIYRRSDTGFIYIVARVISQWASVHLNCKIGKTSNSMSGLICYTLFYIPCRMWVTNYCLAFLWFCHCKAVITNFAIVTDVCLYNGSDVISIVSVIQLMNWNREIKVRIIKGIQTPVSLLEKPRGCILPDSEYL